MSEFEKYMAIMEKISVHVTEDELPSAVKKIWLSMKAKTQILINNAKKNPSPYILSPISILLLGASKLAMDYPSELSEKAIELMNQEIDSSIKDKTLILHKNVKRLRHED